MSASNYAGYANTTAMWKNAGSKGYKKSKVSSKLTSIKRASEANATAKKLAANFPKEHQQKMEMVFNESYKLYLQAEPSAGIPKGDVAGAVGTFIVTNYVAFHDRKIIVSKKEILAVVDQVRGSLASNADFTKASETEKKNMYEQMATIAMFIALANNEFKQHPNPEGEKNLHNTASTLLEKFLKMPADKIKINKNGLQFL